MSTYYVGFHGYEQGVEFVSTDKDAADEWEAAGRFSCCGCKGSKIIEPGAVSPYNKKPMTTWHKTGDRCPFCKGRGWENNRWIQEWKPKEPR